MSRCKKRTNSTCMKNIISLITKPEKPVADACTENFSVAEACMLHAKHRESTGRKVYPS